MKYRILKDIGTLQRGQIVEDPEWRNLGLLIKQKKVEEVKETKPKGKRSKNVTN